MLNNYFNETPLESSSVLEISSVFQKSEEFFNSKQLTNPMMADSNFNENFTAGIPVRISKNVWNNIHNCFCWQIYQLLLKVITGLPAKFKISIPEVFQEYSRSFFEISRSSHELSRPYTYNIFKQNHAIKRD